ncbi:MAG: 2OG-Fe(II) oxygenase [Rubrivivax sp.]
MSPVVQSITPELRRWIVAHAEAGCQPEDVVQAMVASGWHEEVAIEALEQTLRGRLEEVRQSRLDPAAAGALSANTAGTAVPEPAVAEGATVIEADGHAVEVVMTMRHPRVVVFGNLLTAAECEELMALARPKLERSETVDTSTGGSEVNSARTSDGMFFERGQHPLIVRLESRIAALINWPVERGEGLQILRYRPGARYEPHYDYFDPEKAGTPRILERGGQRVGTLVMYLNTPERGGSTTFPDAGLEVAPVRGSAVFFSYDRPHPSTRTLHGGAPVLAGEKWVATKWLRQGVFR